MAPDPSQIRAFSLGVQYKRSTEQWDPPGQHACPTAWIIIHMAMFINRKVSKLVGLEVNQPLAWAASIRDAWAQTFPGKRSLTSLHRQPSNIVQLLTCPASSQFCFWLHRQWKELRRLWPWEYYWTTKISLGHSWRISLIRWVPASRW